jgi:hypothetical protein
MLGGHTPDMILTEGTIRPIRPFYTGDGDGGQFNLTLAARNWTIIWMILQACGWQAGELNPSSPPVRVTFRHGKGSFGDGLISNPAFFEMVMGWMIGWTEPGRPVTGFAAWLRRSRGQLSRLLIGWEPEPA